MLGLLSHSATLNLGCSPIFLRLISTRMPCFPLFDRLYLCQQASEFDSLFRQKFLETRNRLIKRADNYEDLTLILFIQKHTGGKENEARLPR